VISIRNNYKPLYSHKINRDKLTRFGTFKPVPLNYDEKKSKHTIKMTLNTMFDYKG